MARQNKLEIVVTAVDNASRVLESNLRLLEAMLGSAEEAQRVMADLESLEGITPIGDEALQRAAQGLVAVGFEAEEVVPALAAVNDAIAAIGGGSSDFDAVVRALIRIEAKGKATGTDLNSIAAQGIPAWELLAEQIGVSVPEAMEMVTAGAVDAETALSALVGGLQEWFGGFAQVRSEAEKNAKAHQAMIDAAIAEEQRLYEHKTRFMNFFRQGEAQTFQAAEAFRQLEAANEEARFERRKASHQAMLADIAAQEQAFYAASGAALVNFRVAGGEVYAQLEADAQASYMSQTEALVRFRIASGEVYAQVAADAKAAALDQASALSRFRVSEGEAFSKTASVITGDLADTLELAADKAAVFGNSFDLVGAQVAATKQEIIQLLEEGYEPSSKAVQDLVDDLYELTEAERATKEAAEALEAGLDAADGAFADAIVNLTNATIDMLELNVSAEALGKILENVGYVASAVGDILGVAFGDKALGQITEIANAAVGLVKGLTSGNPFQIVAAGINLAISLLGDTSNGLKQVNEQIKQTAASSQYLSEELVRGLTVTERVSRGGFLGFLGFKKTEIVEEATDIGIEIARSIAQGLAGAFNADTLEEFRTSFTDSINTIIKEGMIEAFIMSDEMQEKILALAEYIREAYQSNGISAAEQAEIDRQRDAILADGEEQYQMMKDAGIVGGDDSGDGTADTPSGSEVDFGSIPPAVQFAVATPLVEAAETMLDAAELMYQTFSGESVVGVSSADVDSLFSASVGRFDTSVGRFEQLYGRVETMYNRLLEEGIDVKVAGEARVSTDRGESATAHLR